MQLKSWLCQWKRKKTASPSFAAALDYYCTWTSLQAAGQLVMAGGGALITEVYPAMRQGQEHQLKRKEQHKVGIAT